MINIIPLFSSHTETVTAQSMKMSTIYKDRKGLEFHLEWIGDECYLKILMEEVDQNYIQRELISKNLHLCDCIDYKQSIEQDIANSLRKHFVLVAKHQGQMVACFIGNDYFEDIFEVSCHHPSEPVSQQMKQFSAFCDQLEYPFIQEIWPLKPKDIFYLNIFYIQEKYQGNGLSLTMTEKFTNKALELNYKYIMALATSKQIQNTLIKRFNYEHKNELYFKDFEYYGKKPFAFVNHHNSCIVLIKKLLVG